jgi:DNA-damage-inducible protein J
MPINNVVRARINEHVKKEAAAVLAGMGLTISDAFRILLTRIAYEKSFPFEPFTPNKKTIEAMEAARHGNLVTVKNIKNLLEDLGAKN